MWFERGLGPASIVIPATVTGTGYSEIAAILWVAHQLSAAAGVVAGRIVGCQRRCGVWKGAQEEECSFARCTLRGPEHRAKSTGLIMGSSSSGNATGALNGIQAIDNQYPRDEQAEAHLLVIFLRMPYLPNFQFQDRIAAASPATSRVTMHVITVNLINLIRSRSDFQDLVHSFHVITRNCSSFPIMVFCVQSLTGSVSFEYP